MVCKKRMHFPFNFGWGNFYSLTSLISSFDKSFIVIPLQISNDIYARCKMQDARCKMQDDLPQPSYGSPHTLQVLAMTAWSINNPRSPRILWILVMME